MAEITIITVSDELPYNRHDSNLRIPEFMAYWFINSLQGIYVLVTSILIFVLYSILRLVYDLKPMGKLTMFIVCFDLWLLVM